MKWLSQILRILWKTWFILYMLLSTLFFYPFLVISIILLKNYDLTYKIYRIWAWSICIAIGIKPEIINRENLSRTENFIMVANHSSELDIILPYTKIKHHFAFLAKEELKKLPFFRINFNGMNVTVDRKSMVSGSSSLIACTQKLKAGISLLIFPEGTRSKTAPQMRKFKAGPFKLAIENEIDIIPVAFLDNYRRLAGGQGIFGMAGPGKSRMVILPPISTKNMTINQLNDLKDETHRRIEQVIQEELQKN